ncbi:MAG: beta-lactamase family protein [Oscillospiraceae bacterium]|nr:beta-lactamase family protein [Oscillospiraceae bacterium]
MKKYLSVLLAAALLLSSGVLASAAQPNEICLDLLREQYAWGEMFVGGGETGTFMVWHNGRVVYESHSRCTHHRNRRQATYSVTKSVLGALTGIALHHGYIESVDQLVIDFFPEARIAPGDESKRDMTIEHLLTMTSGMPGMMDRGSMNGIFNLRDSGLASFESPQLSAPGEEFRYCSGATPQTLVGLLQRATGRNLLDFAREHLFDPLGMISVYWDTTWDGSPMGGFGLHLSPRDMMRFGVLHLQHGVWEGQQILPANWVAESKPRMETFILPYGYLFWGSENEFGTFVSAMGLGGSIISIYHDQDVVVVRTGRHNPLLRVGTAGISALGFVGRVNPIPGIRRRMSR